MTPLWIKTCAKREHTHVTVYLWAASFWAARSRLGGDSVISKLFALNDYHVELPCIQHKICTIWYNMISLYASSNTTAILTNWLTARYDIATFNSHCQFSSHTYSSSIRTEPGSHPLTPFQSSKLCLVVHICCYVALCYCHYDTLFNSSCKHGLCIYATQLVRFGCKHTLHKILIFWEGASSFCNIC